jgi:hypothetical protein
MLVIEGATLDHAVRQLGPLPAWPADQAVRASADRSFSNHLFRY